jgi:tripeptide aminopeptidase
MDSLLERFCRYVQIETTACEDAKTYPSSPNQLVLGKLLTAELQALGLSGAEIDEHGIVMATVSATAPGAPTIAWIAHVDTSPEFTAKGVKPIVHRNYDGKDIVLPANPQLIIRVADTDGLAACAGKTLVTADGTTLLGADDKSGVAVIMEAVAYLLAHPEVPHGDIRICFTCDEEVGHGTEHISLPKLNAVAAYTLDGEGQGLIENETFSADLAVITIEGVNIHPGYGKGRMVNAVRLAGEFLTRLPFEGLAPETTDKRRGFLHPYIIEGGVPETRIKILLRDFETAALADKRQILQSIAREIEGRHPKAKVKVDIQTQYRNMAEGLAKVPRVVELAVRAMKAVGLVPHMSIIRGGTDGSRLTEMGLPTPNLSTGMHNFHSPLEWACLEEMEVAVKVLVQLAQEWTTER